MIRPPHPPSESPSAAAYRHTPRRRRTLAAAAAAVAAAVALFGAGTAHAAVASDVTFPPPDATHNTSVIGPASGSAPVCPIIAPIPTSPPSVTGPDSVKPTAPGKPVVTLCGGALYVTWSPGTDNIGIQKWTLIRRVGDVVLATTTYEPGYRLTNWDSYQVFWVDAVDYAGNHSPLSESTSYGTPPSCPTPVTCPTPSGPVTTSAAPVATCSVTYTIVSEWAGSFQGEVKVRNTGSASVSPWTLGFSFPGGQRIGQIWGATQTQSGAAVTVRGEDWNKVIAPGGSVSFGFIGSWTGSNAKPTAFTLNGGRCQVA